MNDSMEQQDSLLGNLIWEYVPSQNEIDFLGRIAFYIALPGYILIGWLIIGFRSFIENLRWWESLQRVLPLIFVAIGFFVVAWFVVKLAHRENQHRLRFYEQGIKDTQINKTRSARYEDLKVWQNSTRVSIYGVPAGSIYNYLIKFPDGSKLRTQNQSVGNLMQEYVTRSQLPVAIDAYRQGNEIDFGLIRVSQHGIATNPSWLRRLAWLPSISRLIPWSDIRYIAINHGVISIKKPRSWFAATSFRAADIPNVYVLLDLLQNLGYLQAESFKRESPWVFLLAGFLIAGPGNFFLYNYFTEWEVEGGRRRMNALVVLLYQIAGKEGVIVLMSLIAVGLIYRGIQGFRTQQ